MTDNPSEAPGRQQIIDLCNRIRTAELTNDQEAFNRAIISLDAALGRLSRGTEEPSTKNGELVFHRFYRKLMDGDYES